MTVTLPGAPVLAGADDFDADGDGFARDDECDDADSAVNPDAVESWYDGVDQDCDGADDFDADADGVGQDEDCDESDPAIHPGAAEAWYDGVDQDCDGADDFDADGDGLGVGEDCDDADAAVLGCPEPDAENDLSKPAPEGCATATGSPAVAVVGVLGLVLATRRRRRW